MAIDKNFVIKNGLEVNEDLLYADDDTGRVGIGKTQPGSTLDVVGDVSLTGIASAGLALTTHDAYMTGFTTSVEGFNIGLGGTVFRLNAIDKKVGINSEDPQYTTDIRGPVSTGTTSLFVFGDLEVTGNIRADQLFGQITDGGTVGFATVEVTQRLTAPDSEVYTLFNIQESGGTDYEFIAGGADPAGIGFTQNTLNPTLYLERGRKYHFDVNASGFPFQIKRDSVADINNRYDDGVENNGSQVGIVTFKVPYNAPGQLFYQSSNTTGMGGTINLVGIFTGYSDNLEVPGISTLTRADVEYLNVTGFTTLGGGGAEASQLQVVGFATLGNTGAVNINVSGVVTATEYIGVAKSAATVIVQERNDDADYQVGFVTANGSSDQVVYIDEDNSQLSYNPSTNTLTVSTVVGNLTGIATGADRILTEGSGANSNFKVMSSSETAGGYVRPVVDNNDASAFTYNPSTNTLIVGTLEGDVTGTATTATTINVQNDDTASDQFIVYVASDVDNSNNRPRVDSELTYNPNTNTLTATNLAGRGDNITNLDASNLSQGTVPGDRGVTAGSGDSSFVEYNGTTKTAGQWYGGTTNPDGTTRLNYDGDLHATEFNGPLNGNASSATQVLVTESDTETDGRLVFVDATGSNQSLLGDNQLTFNSSTNALTVTSGTIQCAGDGSNFGNTTLDATTVESLNVTNTTASTNRTTGAVTVAGGVGIVGDLNVGGDITAFATSDEGLKDNIEPIPNALLKIKKISGNTFDWNEQSSRSGSECGVIAQEIESLGLPGLVTTREDGHKAVRYEKLVPLLIEAIKELTERVQELEK